MLRSVFSITFFAFFWPVLAIAVEPVTSAASPSPKNTVVVWRLEAKSGVEEKDVDSLTGIITAEIEKRMGVKAVSDADVRALVQGEEKRQKCGGGDNSSCIAEIGAALGASEAFSGDLGRVGDYWLLNLRHINVRQGKVVGRAGLRIKGDSNALIEAIPRAVAELFGEAPPSAETAAPAPVASHRFRKAAYATLFSGAALVVFGGVSQWRMDKAKTDFEAGKSGAKSRHALWKGMAVTGYTLGGLAMATGIGLFIADALEKPQAAPVAAAKPSVAFGAAPGGANLALTWAY